MIRDYNCLCQFWGELVKKVSCMANAILDIVAAYCYDLMDWTQIELFTSVRAENTAC